MKIYIYIKIYLFHLSLASFCGTKTNSVDQDQMPYNVASYQGLHCLLPEISIRLLKKQTLKTEMDWSNWW